MPTGRRFEPGSYPPDMEGDILVKAESDHSRLELKRRADKLGKALAGICNQDLGGKGVNFDVNREKTPGTTEILIVDQLFPGTNPHGPINRQAVIETMELATKWAGVEWRGVEGSEYELKDCSADIIPILLGSYEIANQRFSTLHIQKDLFNLFRSYEFYRSSSIMADILDSFNSPFDFPKIPEIFPWDHAYDSYPLHLRHRFRTSLGLHDTSVSPTTSPRIVSSKERKNTRADMPLDYCYDLQSYWHVREKEGAAFFWSIDSKRMKRFMPPQSELVSKVCHVADSFSSFLVKKDVSEEDKPKSRNTIAILTDGRDGNFWLAYRGARGWVEESYPTSADLYRATLMRYLSAKALLKIKDQEKTEFFLEAQKLLCYISEDEY